MAESYSRDSPLISPGRIGGDAWLRALQAKGVDRADAIVTAYHTLAPNALLNPDLALAQAALETGWFSSEAWKQRHNPAGIGITGPGVEGPTFPTLADGVKAHLAHQCAYVYASEACPAHRLGWRDPRHNFHDGRLGGALWTLKGADRGGHDWAADPDYIEKIVALANGVAGEAAPMPDNDELNLRVAHIPKENANRPGRKIEARYITVHETANTSPGATADMHRAYTHAGGGEQLTSYNYVVDDLECIELVPVGESSHHAGTPAGNTSGISIELCVNNVITSPEWAATQARGAALVAHLYQHVSTLFLPIDGLVNHGHWRNTACPARLRANDGAGWSAFVADVNARLAGALEPILPPPLTVVKIGDHWVGGGFLAYYQAAGADALEYFGLPMTEELPLVCEDGQTRTCQVFEKSILEYHPDAPADYTIQVRRLGAEWLASHEVESAGSET